MNELDDTNDTKNLQNVFLFNPSMTFRMLIDMLYCKSVRCRAAIDILIEVVYFFKKPTRLRSRYIRTSLDKRTEF